ncbi:MAG: phage integrase N-terminal SAM-like domain-containing protein [Bacteroidota bacterium]|nr:phage integrase N-terminal SAM-like domain-containing protein [Bacteroidota bacterium]
MTVHTLSIAPGRAQGLFETMSQEMRLRNYSHKTLKAYRSCIRTFVRYFSPKHPRKISNSEIRTFLLHLMNDEQWEASSVNQMFTP